VTPDVKESVPEKFGQATSQPDGADGKGNPGLGRERRPLYRLCKSDVLVVTFAFAPEFNQTVTVQPDGYITLRDVGRLVAKGLTAADLENVIQIAYGKILHEPQVTVALIDEVIVAIPHPREITQVVIREARRNHLDVRIVPELFGSETHEPRIENLGTVPLVTLHREEIPVARLMMKRILDVMISGPLLLLTFPVLILIGSFIRLESPGPIFYAALRVGRKGKRFRCFKFRTMVADANDRQEELRRQNQRRGHCFNIVDDPRITRVGRRLRRYSLDELPQLWNVLRGDMSLVGPRPHPLDDFARYELDHMRRVDVAPGITGLWQVIQTSTAGRKVLRRDCTILQLSPVNATTPPRQIHHA